MSAVVASREALAKAIREHQAVATGLGEWACKCSPGEWRPAAHRSAHVADALIASGAVVAADSLADDAALVAAVASGCLNGLHVTEWGPRYTPTEGAQAALRALAAALEERAQ